jgi:hypothetical protein
LHAQSKLVFGDALYGLPTSPIFLENGGELDVPTLEIVRGATVLDPLPCLSTDCPAVLQPSFRSVRPIGLACAVVLYIVPARSVVCCPISASAALARSRLRTHA